MTVAWNIFTLLHKILCVVWKIFQIKINSLNNRSNSKIFDIEHKIKVTDPHRETHHNIFLERESHKHFTKTLIFPARLTPPHLRAEILNSWPKTTPKKFRSVPKEKTNIWEAPCFQLKKIAIVNQIVDAIYRAAGYFANESRFTYYGHLAWC